MPRISSHFRALGFGKTSAPNNDPPSPRVWKRLKADIKLGVAQTAGVDLRNVRREESRDNGIEWSGLRGLAGVKLTGSHGVEAVLGQLLEYRRTGQPIAELSDLELVQVYKNVKRNASLLTAIAEIHGNPSELHDFATSVARDLTAEMHKRGMRADEIKPKPFDMTHPDNADIVATLDQLFPKKVALQQAWDLPIQIGDDPRHLHGKLRSPASFLDLIEEHRSVFASGKFWSHNAAQDNFEAFGLALSIANLRSLSAHSDAGDKIMPWHLEALAHSLKTRDGKWDKTFAERVMTVDLSKTSPEPLVELIRTVAAYYLEKRDQDQPGEAFNFQGETALINLHGEANLKKVTANLNEAFANSDPAKAIQELEAAFSDFVNSSNFLKGFFIEPLKAFADEPEPALEAPLIFHP